MKTLGTFETKGYGPVLAIQTTYLSEDGPLAIMLVDLDNIPLTVLSVNLTFPTSNRDSRELPPNCFFVKSWEDNGKIAEEAKSSGLFLPRPDLGTGKSGFVTAPVWEVL